MGDLREFLKAVGDATEDDVDVHFSVAPRSNMPTDPGGEIHLSVTVDI